MSLVLAAALALSGAARAAAPSPAPTLAAEAPAAKKPPAKELPGEDMELQTADGWTIAARYSPSTEEDQLTFILLHDARGRMQNWYYLAKKMASRGVGYLALDMRGHGRSVKAPAGQPATWREFIVKKGDNPYEGVREDIAAAAKFLESKGIPAEAVALGGADLGGSLAMKYAALHPEIAMVFVLSPGMSYHDIPTVNAVRAYRDRPILFVTADDDRKSAAETAILYQFARQADGDQNVTLIRAAKGHGTRMLVFSKGLVDELLDWVDNPVKAPELEPGATNQPALDGQTPLPPAGALLDESTSTGTPRDQDPAFAD